MPDPMMQQQGAPMPQSKPKMGLSNTNASKLMPFGMAASDELDPTGNPQLPTTEFDRFDAPVPGESLTLEPGNQPWERPPMHTDLEEALDTVFSMLLTPRSAKGILTLLKKGVPVEALAKAILFTGFSEGKWSVDLMLLMFKPVVMMIAAMGSRGSIKDMKLQLKQRKSTDFMESLMKDDPFAETRPKEVTSAKSLIKELRANG